MHRANRQRGARSALLCCVLLMACGSSSTATTDRGGDSVSTVSEDESQATRGGKLVFGLTAESSGWSPVADQWALDGHFVASTIYDPLMAVAPNREIVPELAEVVEHNDDFSRWTLHLRRGVQFHDGSPFDADAVKANLDASRRGIGAVTLTPIASVDAVDPATVVVTMRTPWSAFPSTLAGQQGYMAAPATLADGSASTHPIGTGSVQSSSTGCRTSVWSVKRNDHYWHPTSLISTRSSSNPLPTTSRGARRWRPAARHARHLRTVGRRRPSLDPGVRVLTDQRAEETVRCSTPVAHRSTT